GDGGSPACLFPCGQAYLGELPAPGIVTGPAGNAPATPPSNGGTTPDSSARAPLMNAPAVQPGVMPRPAPAWGAGMMNPANIPGYYPGALNYGPQYGIGAPAYYPGFPNYGPANGLGTPPNVPGST